MSLPTLHSINPYIIVNWDQKALFLKSWSPLQKSWTDRTWNYVLYGYLHPTIRLFEEIPPTKSPKTSFHQEQLLRKT